MKVTLGELKKIIDEVVNEAPVSDEELVGPSSQQLRGEAMRAYDDTRGPVEHLLKTLVKLSRLVDDSTYQNFAKELWKVWKRMPVTQVPR